MKHRNKYWLYIFMYVLVVVILMVASIYYSTRSKMIDRLSNDITTVTKSSNQISVLLSSHISNGSSPAQSQLALQKSLGSETPGFMYNSVINWAGKIIAHPDVIKTDGIADYYNAQNLNDEKEFLPATIYKNLEEYQGDQVVLTTPVAQTDWIVTTHINIERYRDLRSKSFFHFTVLFSVVGLSIILMMFFILKLLKSHYERLISDREAVLTDGVLNFSKLNENLEHYQAITIEEINKSKTADVPSTSAEITEVKKEQLDAGKSRILTYVRNELLPISVEDIAYIYVENTITYFIRKDGKRSTSNESLDQIYASLDERLFFKANRQFIVAVSAIEKIVKYGNSQLKLVMKPGADLEIIVGKNKAASFKKWLNT